MRGRVLGAALFIVALAPACSPAAALTPDQIVAAFIAASQDDARTMHMEFQATMHTSDMGLGIGAMTSTVNGSFDFNGPDYAGVATSSSLGLAGATSQVAFARVGGAGFENFSNSGWQRSDQFGVPIPEFDPLRSLSTTDVAYEAPDTLDGRPVHRLRVSDPNAILASSIFATTGVGAPEFQVGPGGRADYLIYVDDAGIPVGAHMALDLTMELGMSPPASPVGYSMEFDYKFSLWGEPVTVSAPQVPGVGGG